MEIFQPHNYTQNLLQLFWKNDYLEDAFIFKSFNAICQSAVIKDINQLVHKMNNRWLIGLWITYDCQQFQYKLNNKFHFLIGCRS